MTKPHNPKGGKAKTEKAARNQGSALRRITAPKKEKLDDGLRRFLKTG
ncbi:hypothetical protein [Mesorhizobium sp. M0701]